MLNKARVRARDSTARVRSGDSIELEIHKARVRARDSKTIVTQSWSQN